ncbi:nuclear protein DGCR14 [Aspergillus unguis]
MTAATETAQREPGPDVSNMGLLDFQARYTSEDNESFNKLLDKQNTKRREKHAWLWSGNKIPTARQIAHRQRETKRIEAQGGNPDQQKQVAIKTDLDARPAKPDAWKPQAENSLMFLPSSIEDSYETIQQKAEASSRAGPNRVVYQNTRIPEGSFEDSNAPPPSPSISAVQDAIAGRPRQTETEAGYSGGETPRVNGYAFVDEDEPEPEPTTFQTTNDSDLNDLRILGASDSTPNPFEIKQNRHREDLHHRMVDRVARTKRAEKTAQTTKTPVTATPRFASSPRLDFGLRTPNSATPGSGGASKALTPAAQKLLSRVGSTPRQRAGSSSSGLKNVWTPTPRRQK